MKDKYSLATAVALLLGTNVSAIENNSTNETNIKTSSGEVIKVTIGDEVLVDTYVLHDSAGNMFSAQHASHSSHQSHASHQSHQSHQSHTSHFSHAF